jgi:RNA polymerase sigma-70 factor (ECF subfamily)
MRTAAALALASHTSADAVDADLELVQKAQRGDRTAFAQLFKKHHGRVRAMCMRMLADPVEVDDAVQQAFLEAWRCLPRFEGRSRFTTWITRVAMHTCFSIRRRLRRLFVSDVAAAADRAAIPVWQQPGLPADEVAARRARDVAVTEVLQQVGAKKRAVFVLADIEGMSSTEIAEILDIPDATVRTRLFHARREVAALVRSHKGFVDVLENRGTARGESDTGEAT